MAEHFRMSSRPNMKLHSIAVIDAAGKQGSGLLEPPIRLLGSKHECENIIAGDNLIKEVYFNGRYCRLDAHMTNITLDHYNPMYTAMYGLCFPDSCSDSDVFHIVSATIHQWSPRFPTTGMQVKCFKDKPYTSDFIFVMILVSTIASLSFVGTFYDLLVCRLRLCPSGLSMKSTTVIKAFRDLFANPSEIPYEQSEDSRPTDNTGNVTYVNGDSVVMNHLGQASTGSDGSSTTSNRQINTEGMHAVDISGKDTLYLVGNELGNDTGHQTVNGISDAVDTDINSQRNVTGTQNENNDHSMMDTIRTDGTCPGNTEKDYGESSIRHWLNQVFLSFSLLRNVPNVLSVKHDEDHIEHVHGIRVLSMAWIILGQTLNIGIKYADNPIQYFNLSRKYWTSMVFQSSINSIDTFFVISGFLLTYQTLKRIDKGLASEKKDLLYFYIHKLWRILPAYMIILAIGTSILPHFLTGPLSNGSLNEMEMCKTNWWKHLLFINNYAERPETSCMYWSWYLACSMQIFLISPVLLVLLYKYSIVGVTVCGVLMVATVMLRGIISNHFEFGITMMSLMSKGILEDYEYYLLFPTHTRMTSFVFGVLVGYFIWRKSRHFDCPKILVITGWTVSISLTSLAVYGTHHWHKMGTSPPQAIADLFNALQTTVWGLAISWIIIACSTNNGGLINKLLSWKLFLPFSRLSYCAFLVHPLVMLLYYENKQKVIYLTQFEVVYMFLGNLVLTYVGAMIITLLFEIPFRTLEKRLFGR